MLQFLHLGAPLTAHSVVRHCAGDKKLSHSKTYDCCQTACRNKLDILAEDSPTLYETKSTQSTTSKRFDILKVLLSTVLVGSLQADLGDVLRVYQRYCVSRASGSRILRKNDGALSDLHVQIQQLAILGSKGDEITESIKQ